MCKRNKRAVKVALLAMLLFLMIWFSIPMTALRVRDSVVMVRVESGGFPRGQASGVIIGQGIILTAGHVVRDANSIDISTEDGRRLVSTKFIKAENTDLGLIIFDCNDVLPQSRLSFCETFIGQTVFGIGSKYGLFNSFFKGFVGDKHVLSPCFGSKGLILLDATGNPGDSGCPVFNRWGNIVGIVVGGRLQGVTLIVPAKICRLFVKQYKANKAMKECK